MCVARRRLLQLADVLALWAATVNFSVPQEYDAVEAAPIAVPARELGSTVPRSVLEKARSKERERELQQRRKERRQLVELEMQLYDVGATPGRKRSKKTSPQSIAANPSAMDLAVTAADGDDARRTATGSPLFGADEVNTTRESAGAELDADHDDDAHGRCSLTSAVDMWSLGLTLLDLATGYKTRSVRRGSNTQRGSITGGSGGGAVPSSGVQTPNSALSMTRSNSGSSLQAMMNEPGITLPPTSSASTGGIAFDGAGAGAGLNAHTMLLHRRTSGQQSALLQHQFAALAAVEGASSGINNPLTGTSVASSFDESIYPKLTEVQRHLFHQLSPWVQGLIRGCLVEDPDYRVTAAMEQASDTYDRELLRHDNAVHALRVAEQVTTSPTMDCTLLHRQCSDINTHGPPLPMYLVGGRAAALASRLRGVGQGPRGPAPAGRPRGHQRPTADPAAGTVTFAAHRSSPVRLPPPPPLRLTCVSVRYRHKRMGSCGKRTRRCARKSTGCARS